MNYGRKVADVSIWNWLGTIILAGIPVVNLIMLLVWAFGSSTPVAKSNWAKATLILMVLGVIVSMAFWSNVILAISYFMDSF